MSPTLPAHENSVVAPEVPSIHSGFVRLNFSGDKQSAVHYRMTTANGAFVCIHDAEAAKLQSVE